MPRFGKFDAGATKDARADGRFKDKRSKILVRFDGSYRIELRGSDASRLREECFNRDRGRCVDAGDGHACHGPLQMSHDPAMSKSAGSDVLEQVFVRCWRHHVLLDFHGQPAHF